jgi:hypothetical protein
VIRSITILFTSLSFSIAVPHGLSGKIQVGSQPEEEWQRGNPSDAVFYFIKFDDEVKANKV